MNFKESKYIQYLLIALLMICCSCLAHKKTVKSYTPKKEAVKKEESKPDHETEPVTKKQKHIIEDSVIYDPKTHPFKVLLLMSFFKNGIDSSEKEIGYRASCIDYYMGIKTGIDSLKKTGINLSLFVEDTELDTNKVASILRNEEYKTCDLVIGPAFNSGIRIAAEYCKANAIKLYIPFKTNYNDSTNQQLMYGTPDNASFASYMVDYFHSNYQKTQFILLKTANKNVAEMDSLLQFYMQYERPELEWIVTLADLNSKTYVSADKFVKPGYKHVFIIPVGYEITANSIMAQIKTVPDAEVYGVEEWISFENANYETWEKMQVNVFSNHYADISNDWVNAFRKQINETYNQEANDYNYQGFNDIVFLGNAMLENGYYFNSKVRYRKYQNYTSGYYFVSRYLGSYNGYFGLWKFNEDKFIRTN